MTARRTIRIDGVNLEAQRWDGRGQPILLLHEGLGSVSMWRDFPARVAEATDHAVIAWSRRGYGASDPLPTARQTDYMHREAELVPLVMDALEVDRAHLLGHSDGGSIALIAASRFPDRVVSLILEAPHTFVEQLTVDSIALTRTIYRTTDFPQKLGRHHANADQVFWRWNDVWLDPRMLEWDIEELLPLIRAPALVIQGLDDEYGTLKQLDRIERALPDTRRLELDDCGHSPHRDQPEAVLAAAARFLEEVDPCVTLSSATR